MEAWVRQNFPVITIRRIGLDGNLEQFEAFCFTIRDAQGERIVEAPISVFLTLWGAVNVPPTATALKAADPMDTNGWHKYFDAWVEQGIIQP